MPISARYIAAKQIALKAGELAHKFFVQRESLVTEHKGAQNFVSRADHAVEELIASRIAAAFPMDAFLGEETAASFAGELDRVWVVDPIDGTHNFLRGARYYCISIAYMEKDQREIGVIYDPEHDELFHAQRGHGAWCERAGNETRIQVSTCAALADAFICVGHRGLGAGALQLAHVAAGHYDAFIELSLNAWDALAGLLLVEEAGGYTAPFPGPEGLRNPAPVLACTKALAEPLTQLIGAW